jgi:AcrR family transcriptional regulator
VTEKFSNRRAKASATRQRIIDAAYVSFCSVGYAGTTMQSVADEAGVAKQTVYFVFHSKPELLSAVVEDYAAGAPDAPPVADRSWHRESSSTSDSRRSLALMVDHGVDIYARVAPLAHSIRDAALTDPAVDIMWSRISINRKQSMLDLMQLVADRGQLRPHLTVAQAADICHAVNSHETYLELVQRSGWAITDYKRWLYQNLCQQLLAPDLLAADGQADALQGLSFSGR